MDLRASYDRKTGQLKVPLHQDLFWNFRCFEIWTCEYIDQSLLNSMGDTRIAQDWNNDGLWRNNWFFMFKEKMQQKGNTNLILWGSKVPCLRPPKPMLDPKHQNIQKNKQSIFSKISINFGSAAPRPRGLFQYFWCAHQNWRARTRIQSCQARVPM